MLRKSSLLAAIVAVLVHAAVRADDAPPPFDLNEDRIKVVHEGDFEADTYLIPTVYLHIAARTQTDAKNEGASAKARVFVEGFTKEMAQGLARKIYDDLVQKVRDAGYKVLTYDDVKGDVAAFARMEANPKFGMPVKMFDKGPGIDFMIVTPSDEQAFDYNFATGPTWPWRDMTKSRKVVTILPQIYYNLPQVWAEKGGGMFSSSVKIKIDPAMKLYLAFINGLPPDLGWCSINIQEHGKRLAAENAGSVQKLAEDKFDSGTKDVGSGLATWQRTVSDIAFVIDPKAVSDGILRVGYAINSRTVKTLKDSH